MSPQNLPSYSVIIVTYGRPEVVRFCIECVFQQSALPQQVIIVDASPDFEKQKAALETDLIVPPGIAFIYRKATRPSTSNQRNEAIAFAKDEEILFFIDDDSFMYPECAKEVLKVYALDKKRQIAGVQPRLAAVPPGDIEKKVVAIANKKRAAESPPAVWAAKNLRFLWRHLFMMASDLHLIPYDGAYHSGGYSLEIGDAAESRTLTTISLLHGCRMTYRAEAIKKEMFDPDLVRYAAAEDLDASYRASRHGALVVCESAELFHQTVAANRLSRKRVAHMAWMNVAMFICKHSNDLDRDRRKYIVYSVRRSIAELVKDIAAKRFSIPQFFGICAGFRDGLQLLNSARSRQSLRINISRLQNNFLS